MVKNLSYMDKLTIHFVNAILVIITSFHPIITISNYQKDKLSCNFDVANIDEKEFDIFVFIYAFCLNLIKFDGMSLQCRLTWGNFIMSFSAQSHVRIIWNIYTVNLDDSTLMTFLKIYIIEWYNWTIISNIRKTIKHTPFDKN